MPPISHGIVPDNTMASSHNPDEADERFVPESSVSGTEPEMPQADDKDVFPTLDEQVESALEKKAEVPTKQEAPAAPTVDDPEFDFGDNFKLPRSKARAALAWAAEQQERLREFNERQAKLAEREKLFEEVGGIEETLARRRELGPNAALFDDLVVKAYAQALKTEQQADLHPAIAARLRDLERQVTERVAKLEESFKPQQEAYTRWQEAQLQKQIAAGYEETYGRAATPKQLEAIIRSAIEWQCTPHEAAVHLYGQPQKQAAPPPPKATGPRMGPPTKATAPAPKPYSKLTRDERDARLADDVAEALQKAYGGQRKFK